MYAVGHLALGYLCAKGCEKALNVRMNLPLILFLSLIPDSDLLIPSLMHRGITHSIIVAGAIFLPIFLIERKRSVPYFAALAQHSLIGDLLSGSGTLLLWPLTNFPFGLGLDMQGPVNVSIETGSFVVALIVLLISGDLVLLLRPRKSNLLLIAPESAIFLSAFFGFREEVPPALLIPHLLLFALFALSMISLVHLKRKMT
jgi:membrane-bound metal-dependent hydrolase YbcI (DUF457 family)